MLLFICKYSEPKLLSVSEIHCPFLHGKINSINTVANHGQKCGVYTTTAHYTSLHLHFASVVSGIYHGGREDRAEQGRVTSKWTSWLKFGVLRGYQGVCTP